MVTLKPELEKRGFEVAVFHATGMGGRAFGSLHRKGSATVMDFAPQEICTRFLVWHGTTGPDRMTNAGKAGTTNYCTACDLVDLIKTSVTFQTAKIMPQSPDHLNRIER